MSDRISAFVAVTFLILVVPGPDFVLVTRNTLAGNRVRGYLTAVGVCTGLAVLTGVTASGVSAVVAANGTALIVLRVMGGAYLLVLAFQFIFKVLRVRSRRAGSEKLARQHQLGNRRNGLAARSPLLQGFLNNVLNPKALIFYITFIPQFLDPAQPIFRQTLLLGLLVMACAATWWGCYVSAIGSLNRLLARQSVSTGIDIAAAVALAGIGVLVLFGEL
jgi:threonine/homoserine/homoserine lactone efflux protein